jgi:outer membrane biosynthesis protein TonB
VERKALLSSAFLHTVVLTLLFANLPFFRTKPLKSPPIIPIEIVSISDLTTSPPKKVKPNKQPIAKTKRETRKAVQKQEAPTPKPTIKKAPSPLKKEEPKTDVKADKKPNNKSKKVKKAPAKTDDFMSVLQAVEEVKRVDHTEDARAVDKAFDSENIADKLSITELDALRQQLQRCWNVPAGALHADELVVAVRVTMGPDAVVRDVKIQDESRMTRDPYFRTAAESAKRALYSPACTPLKLPKDRYAEWQTFEITFNPQEMV